MIYIIHGHALFNTLNGAAHYYGFNLSKDVNSNEPMNGTAIGNQPVTVRMSRGRTNQQSKATPPTQTSRRSQEDLKIPECSCI